MVFRRIAGLIGVISAFAAHPLHAETILEPSSDWSFRADEDKCRLSRRFGEGEQAVTLWLDQGGAQQSFNLTLIGEPFANPYGRGIRIKPGAEDEIIRSFIAAKSSKGRPVLKMYGFALSQPRLERDLEAKRPDARISEERASAIDTLAISGAGLEPVVLKLGAMGAQFGFLQGCGERLEAVLSEAGRALTGEARPPEPIDSDNWLSTKDWPAYLKVAEMSGEITVRLTVGKSGQATGCTVVDSNKPQLFDDPVCLGLLKRARFNPARDGIGDPVPSYYHYKVSFYFR